MIICDRCGGIIEYDGTELKFSPVGHNRIACRSCWKEFEEGQEKIKTELMQKREEMVKNWFEEWQRNKPQVNWSDYKKPGVPTVKRLDELYEKK